MSVVRRGLGRLREEMGDLGNRYEGEKHEKEKYVGMVGDVGQV